jgi:hypothetical protein
MHCVDQVCVARCSHDGTAILGTTQVSSEGYQVDGLETDAETSWIYVLPKGIDPSDIIVTR